jgi:predicted translin family RNA/ssDNA-binding protein
VIKRTRDVQRLSKKAIFSLLRGDSNGGASLLHEALEAIQAILPDIETSPELRAGAFTQSLEEYAEGVSQLSALSVKCLSIILSKSA